MLSLHVCHLLLCNLTCRYKLTVAGNNNVQDGFDLPLQVGGGRQSMTSVTAFVAAGGDVRCQSTSVNAGEHANSEHTLHDEN
jgi:hypothetical protein